MVYTMVIKFQNLLHHYFLPHETNNYRAKTLHSTSVIFYILLLIVFQTGIIVVKQVQPQILGYATDITVEKLLSLVNQKRSENGLSPLSLSSELSTAATQKATDMFSQNYWAHISPTGATPWKFITDAGYNYLYAGENLAKSFATSEEVIEAWMKSPTHRGNILKPEYTDIGITVVNGSLKGEETTLIVQQLGSRAGKNIGDRAISPPEERQAIVDRSSAAIETTMVGIAKPKQSLFPSSISKTFSLVLAEFLLIILFVDSIYIWRHKTMRLSGHSFAHLLFFGALIGAMGATGMGVIL